MQQLDWMYRTDAQRADGPRRLWPRLSPTCPTVFGESSTHVDAWEAAVEERSERLVQRYESVTQATVSTKID